MAFRVLCYQIDIIRRHLNTHVKKLPLPYVKTFVYLMVKKHQTYLKQKYLNYLLIQIYMKILY